MHLAEIYVLDLLQPTHTANGLNRSVPLANQSKHLQAVKELNPNDMN